MSVFLVTGATSMLGSELVNYLSKDSIVYAVVRKDTTKLSNLIMNSNIKLLYYEMIDYNKISIEKNKIDGVFHFAWDGVRNPYRNDKTIQENNFKMSIEFYTHILKYKPDFFFGIGSQGEYGPYQVACAEDLVCNPESQYGIYKNKFREFLQTHAYYDGIRFLWGRVFSAYGPKDYQMSLIMSSIRKMKNNEEVDLSPCEHIWTYTYSKDIIKSIILLVNSQCSGIYNITNSDNIKLKEYIVELKDILLSKSKLNFGVYKYNGEIPNMVADNSKLVRDTGYEPDYSFEKGIKEMLEEMNNGN